MIADIALFKAKDNYFNQAPGKEYNLCPVLRQIKIPVLFNESALLVSFQGPVLMKIWNSRPSEIWTSTKLPWLH